MKNGKKNVGWEGVNTGWGTEKDTSPVVRNKNCKGKRGRLALKNVLENHFGTTNIWPVLNEKFNDVETMPGALARLSEITEGKVKASAQTFKKMLTTGVKAGRFPKDTPLYLLGKVRPRRTKAAMEAAKPEAEVIPVEIESIPVEMIADTPATAQAQA